MIKLLGAFFLIIVAYVSALKVMEPEAEHIRMLEEGDLLYRILESEIRNTKTPLPLLFGELSDRTATCWRAFFLKFPLHCLEIQKKVFLLYMKEYLKN